MACAWPRALAFLLLASSSLAMAQPSGSTAPVSAEPPTFLVRADATLASRLNPFFAAVARPVETAMPVVATDPAAVLREVCGASAPHGELIVGADGVRSIRHLPCLQFASDVKIKVRKGDYRETLALRMGLRPNSEASFKVVRGPNSSAKAAKDLDVGDLVIAPQIPLWTKVPLKSAIGRATFIAGMAHALGCAKDPNQCLIDFNISVVSAGAQASVKLSPGEDPPKPPQPDVEAAPPLKPSADTQPAPTPAPAASAPRRNLFQRLFIDPFKRRRDDARLFDTAAFAADFGRDAAQTGPADPAPAEPQAQAPQAAVTLTATAEPPRVAPGQWPYDADLVRRVLEDVRSKDPGVQAKSVGVIDVGLRDAFGAPFSQESFLPDVADIDPRERRGAGAPWPTDDGGIALCKGVIGEAATRDDLQAQQLNHGAITASLAIGTDLRAKGGAAGALLPRLIYFRAYRSPCPASNPSSLALSDVWDGFRFLADETDILSVSFQDDSGGDNVDNAVVSALESKTKLLVTAAGNRFASNLDEGDGAFCPACLANPKVHASTADRVLAVGAAKPNLERYSFSGFGTLSVTVYAPGETLGAIDLFGQDASRFPPATSYAAPRVALAAALVRALAPGVDIDQIARRLRLAVWPLYENGAPLPQGGVLDLAKAVAVRHYAVERLISPDGATPYYQTYVGEIVGGLKALTFCPGESPFIDYKIQAVTLGPQIGGKRQIVAYPQRPTKGKYHAPPLSCAPTGDLKLKELGSSAPAITIPLSEVTRILVPMRLD